MTVGVEGGRCTLLIQQKYTQLHIRYMTLVEMVMGGVSPTLTGDHQNRITDYTAIVLEIHDDSDAEKILRCENKGY